MNIKLSDKISFFLIKKFNLTSIDELSDLVEEAVLKHYKISLLDINEDPKKFYKKGKKNRKNKNKKEDIKNFNTNFYCYVYVYLDPRKKGKWVLDENQNKYLNYQPFYIGKGQNNRAYSHLYYSQNEEVNKIINELRKEGKDPIIKITDINLQNLIAHNIENKYIAKLREQGVDLYNKTLQDNSKKYGKLNIESLNIEKHINKLIIETLNKSKSVKDAARKLNISERTLYRKMNSLNIIKDASVYKFKDVSEH